MIYSVYKQYNNAAYHIHDTEFNVNFIVYKELKLYKICVTSSMYHSKCTMYHIQIVGSL